MLACSRTVTTFAVCSLTSLRCRYATKFSERPPHKNVDVNLTVAWWGNARGNAV